MGDDAGKTFGASAGWAAAPNDAWSYRLSAGYFNSDPWPRPVGTVPVGTLPTNPEIKTGGGRYPIYDNQGTSQPRFDLRVDQELSENSRITYSVGAAGSDGMITTGISPFDIQRARHATSRWPGVAFNRAGSAQRLRRTCSTPRGQCSPWTRSPAGQWARLQKTSPIWRSDPSASARRHSLTAAATRRNNFDISIAPRARDRDEFGAYLPGTRFSSTVCASSSRGTRGQVRARDPVFSPPARSSSNPPETMRSGSPTTARSGRLR